MATRVVVTPRVSPVMPVRLHLLDPFGDDEAFDAQTVAPSWQDQTMPVAWWGAFAVAAALRLEEAVHADSLSWFPVVDGVPLVNVAFPAADATGPALDSGDGRVVVHEFILD